MNDMLTAAIAAHEVYTSYIKAGFTEAQAFELVKVAIASAPKGDA